MQVGRYVNCNAYTSMTRLYYIGFITSVFIFPDILQKNNGELVHAKLFLFEVLIIRIRL